MMTYADPAELEKLTQCESETAKLALQLATNAVDSYLRRSLEVSEDSKVLPASGDRALYVVPAGWPLKVESVTVDDATLTEGEDFRVRADGVLWRLAGRRWNRDVEITYQTGFKGDAPELLTAKRIVLELASRAVANPQLLDSLTLDGTSPNFVVREGQNTLPQFALSALQRASLDPMRWRRRLA